MIEHNGLVYFETNDKKEEVKKYLKSALSSDYLDEGQIRRAIDNIKDSKIEHAMKGSLVKILTEAQDNLNKLEGGMFKKGIQAFFALLDYITRNQGMDMSMQFDLARMTQKDTSANIQGFFKDEIWNVSRLMGGNPITFYYDLYPGVIPKPLKFNNFNQDINKIKNYYLADTNIEEVQPILNEYIAFKKNIEKPKIKPKI